jgi:hypothetical protein
MRVAETRAVNRALRKAYGIGLCSVEEIGSLPRSSSASVEKIPPQHSNGSGSGNHKLRDRLCQIIRQHRLDPAQVKLYAAEHCGTAELRDSTREQIESFVKFASRDRQALLQKLSSYSQKTEGAA